MKLIIAGSRDITDYNILLECIEHFDLKWIREIVSGTARGVDQLGERYAKENDIECVRFEAQWETYGKSAGYKRNKQMGSYADALLAITNGSRGTQHMIDIANRKRLKVWGYNMTEI